LVVGGNASSNVSIQTRGMVANLGMASLWRGSSAMISAVPMQNALLMGGYGIGKQWASDNNQDDDQAITLMSVFVGGCTGGIIQSFFMSPIELMKVNQQVVGKSAKAAGMELVRGLNSRNKSWRGLNATLLRDGIPHGVWFASYEWCKTALGERLKGSTGEQLTVPLASGAFAATVAWVRIVLFCIVCIPCCQ
jgi:solute carrier family 25 carnitine/acylcarnitine transporter 20/29